MSRQVKQSPNRTITGQDYAYVQDANLMRFCTDFLPKCSPGDWGVIPKVGADLVWVLFGILMADSKSNGFKRTTCTAFKLNLSVCTRKLRVNLVGSCISEYMHDCAAQILAFSFHFIHGRDVLAPTGFTCSIECSFGRLKSRSKDWQGFPNFDQFSLLRSLLHIHDEVVYCFPSPCGYRPHLSRLEK